MTFNNSAAPLLILFKGYPGTGKSYLAKRLSDNLGISLIVRDKLKTKLAKRSYPSDSLGSKSYEMMWGLAEAYLKNGQSCICDTSLVQPHGLKIISDLANKYSARVIVIECHCLNVDVQLKRISKRQKYPSYYSIKTVRELAEFIQKNSQYENYVLPYTTIKIDTSTDYDLLNIIEQINLLFTENKAFV